MTLAEDLEAAAKDEIVRACTLKYRDLSKHLPWGDTFEGFSPGGRDVCFERNYLWDGPEGGDIRVEVNVFEPQAFETGVRITRLIHAEPSTPRTSEAS